MTQKPQAFARAKRKDTDGWPIVVAGCLFFFESKRTAASNVQIINSAVAARERAAVLVALGRMRVHVDLSPTQAAVTVSLPNGEAIISNSRIEEFVTMKSARASVLPLQVRGVETIERAAAVKALRDAADEMNSDAAFNAHADVPACVEMLRARADMIENGNAT